jgi:hypothetical protein
MVVQYLVIGYKYSVVFSAVELHEEAAATKLIEARSEVNATRGIDLIAIIFGSCNE